MQKEDHQNDGRPEFGPVEDSSNSNLPSSMVSLSLKRTVKGEKCHKCSHDLSERELARCGSSKLVCHKCAK